MRTFSEARAFSFLVLALATLFLAFVFVAYATSIGTNVTVTGTLTGEGVNVFSGQLQASSTALLGAATTFYNTVGIGTATPAQRFSLQGNALISGNLTSVANVTATGTMGIGSTTHSAFLSVEASSTNPVLTLQQGAAGGGGNILDIYRGTSKIGVITEAPNWGLGTSSPSQELSVQGNVLISGNLTSVANVTATGTLNVTGLTTLVSATTTHIGVTGTASTTRLVVGGGGSTIAGIIFGFCNISSGTIAASSTVATNCTSATGVATNDRVFVMATSSLPTNFIVLSASSTAADTIGLYIRNMDGPPAVTTTGNISLNFISIR